MTVTFVVAISIVLGLLLFLIREVRRPPGPMEWGRTPRWGKRLRVTLYAIILLIGLMFFWAFLIEPNRLIVREQAIRIDSGEKVRRGLEQNGIKVLDDEVAQVNVREASLWLVGLADLWERPQRVEQTIEKVPQGVPVIALTHNPDIFPGLPQRVPLLLAGHTHGGQIRFPFIGAVVQSSRFGKKYERGHVFENSRHLFVTTGIGTSILPLRFGVTPEIILLTVNSP